MDKNGAHMSCSRILQLLGLSGIILFIASAFTPLTSLLSNRADTQAPVESAEAIVVLGGGLQSEGVLNNSSLRRALQGIILYQKGFAPRLVLLGGARGEGPAESAIRAELAQQLGISPEAILTEAGARTTQGRRSTSVLSSGREVSEEFSW